MKSVDLNLLFTIIRERSGLPKQVDITDFNIQYKDGSLSIEYGCRNKINYDAIKKEEIVPQKRGRKLSKETVGGVVFSWKTDVEDTAQHFAMMRCLFREARIKGWVNAEELSFLSDLGGQRYNSISPENRKKTIDIFNRVKERRSAKLGRSEDSAG